MDKSLLFTVSVSEERSHISLRLCLSTTRPTYTNHNPFVYKVLCTEGALTAGELIQSIHPTMEVVRKRIHSEGKDNK